jgi:formylglycine-generating enzyme required for sulfatase activity
VDRIDDSSALAQTEIFGRFVLLEQMDASGGAETSRAVDLARELQPLVTVRRLPRWGTFSDAERSAFRAASMQRALGHATLLAPHVGSGEIGGVPFWATEYIPGVSVDRVLERAIDRGGLSLHTTFTIAYCVSAVLLDLHADGTSRTPASKRVAPLLHPRRIVVAWSGRPFFLGTSYEQEFPDDEERRYGGADRANPAMDALSVAALVFELCTGLSFNMAMDGKAEGPLGRVPVEAHEAMRRALALEMESTRDLVYLYEQLMRAAGGGVFADVARELGALFPDEQNLEAAQIERDHAMARRFQKRMKARASAEALTTKLRIRPASQEGLATGDPLERKKSPADDMVLVKGGRFLFGTPEDAPSYVDVAPFLVDRAPVTCADWQRFMEATGAAVPAASNGTPDDDRARAPVVGVTRAQAEAYAAWLGKRLPSEVEWELMARGFDGRVWPWGASFDASCLHETWRTPWSERQTVEVGLLPQGNSPFGVGDIGQVWEWTSTPHVDGGHVVRGGPWRNRREPPMVTNRSREDSAAPDVGFRLVKSVSDLDDQTQ